MNTNNPIEEEAKLILDMYEYALANNLNVENRNDVIKILEALDQTNISDDHLEQLVKAIQITAKRIQSDLDSRKKVN